MKNFLNDLNQNKKKFEFYKIRNQKNFNSNFLYLKNKVFINLTINLNKYHKIDLNKLYWKILLEPWLTIYISKNLYYWNLVNFYKSKKKFNFYRDLEILEPPFDTIHFLELSKRDDTYNNYMIQKIQNFVFHSQKKKTSFVKLKKNIYKKFNFHNYFNENKSLFKIFYHKILAPILNKNKIIFDLSNIGLKKIKLNLNFYQIPCWIEYMYNYEVYDKLFIERSNTNKQLRDSFKKKYKKKTFSNFLISNIYDDLPKVFLEDFKKISESIKSIKLKPKIVVSDNKEFDLFFKFWISLNKLEKIKFIRSDHGGSYMSNLDDMTHEEYSNLSLRWFKYRAKNSIQLPILQNLKKRIRPEKRTKALIISHGVDKYPHHVLWSPVGKENFFQSKLIFDFTRQINPEIKKNLYLKTYPDKFASKDWSCYKDFKKIILKDKIITDKEIFEEIFLMSKINICLYPQTAFIESMLSGPTILIINSNFYRIRPEFVDIHNELKKVKILFNSGSDACHHINKVWDRIDEWWEDDKVKRIRKKFEKIASKKKSEKETTREWIKFFKKIY